MRSVCIKSQVSGGVMMRAGSGKTLLELSDSLFPIENFRYLHDELACRVIILEQQETFVFVSIDLTSLQEYAIEAIKKEVGRKYAVPLEHIFISVTHTFSAPHTRSIEALKRSSAQIQEKNKLFLKSILAAVAGAVEEAIKTLQRIKIIGQTTKTDATINRDVEQAEGYWIGRNPEGFSDGTVSILKFVTESQELLAVIYSMDVQSSLVETMDKEAVSSDFIGSVSKCIEDNFNCPALFMLGAAADQVPRMPSKDFQELVQQASELGNVIIRTLNQEIGESNEQISLGKVVMTVKGQEFPDRKELNPTRNYKFISSTDREVVIYLLTFGEAVIVMMKPEITSIIGSQIRACSPYKTTLVATMINGGQKYMADEESYQKCTYEAMNSMFACGSAEVICTKVIEELAKKEVKKCM